VNASNEAQKSGVSKDEMMIMAKSIYQNLDQEYNNIVLKGLMTIGKLEGDPSDDFQVCFEMIYGIV
jgi:uncharacterized pyridoxal phosphate-containing UPF0001 family protein